MKTKQHSSLLAHYESQENWAHARRGVLVQRVVCAFKNCSVDLIPFEEVRTHLHLTQKYCRGIQDIELARIRGSVGRYKDFTSAFLPRRSHLQQEPSQQAATRTRDCIHQPRTLSEARMLDLDVSRGVRGDKGRVGFR